jgi:ferredoxin
LVRETAPTVEVGEGTDTAPGAGTAETGTTDTGTRAKVQIQADQCNGCGICAQLCRFDAIKAPSNAATPSGSTSPSGAASLGRKTPGDSPAGEKET